ncbi:zinc ABC transporter substrate-binding protein [uncultured Cardiobacterium sp.]|uniref:zinc ABC transporter substrate-binding protein n=1 Tax=uncultured Cardiobacterium sp. TaxID=417619 RepID=UPI0026256458|nr:zinc ABC transporter substrate-binding protein [uncultured Cardiobacterium sp.]
MKHILLAALVGIACHAYAAPKVVTTIKPLHSLVAQVMDGVGEPELLIKQGSPHGYQMKPADAKNVAEADLVLYVSHELETFMPPLLKKSGKEHSIEWAALPNLYPLPTRHGGMWEEGDDDDDHDHGDHHHHEHEHGHEQGHDHHGHHHGAYDAHLWLSIARSKLLLEQTATELAAIDPANAAKYKDNAAQAAADLDALKAGLTTKLQPVQKRPFMVFHDAYQYFEQDYDLDAVGTVRVDPEHEPGAKRISELHQMIADHKIVCLFSEPQFPAKIVTKLAADGNVKTAVLDPVGADLAPGKTMYRQLLTNLADNLAGCLKP